MEIRNARLLTGFALYGVLAVLATVTLADWRFRGGVLILLAALAFKTWIHQRTRI